MLGTFSASFSMMENMSQKNVKVAVLENLYDFSSMLEVADQFLLDYHKVLQEARGILLRGAYGIHTPQDRQEMIDQLIMHADELKKIVQYSQFNSMPLFFQENNSFKKEVWVVLNENCEAQLFEINNPLFLDEKLTLQDIYHLTADTDSFMRGLYAIDQAIYSHRLVRNQIKAYQLRIQNLISLQKDLMKDSVASQSLMKKYVATLEDQMYELSIRACNGIFTAEDRILLDTRFQVLKQELNRVQKVNGIKHHFSQMKNANILQRKTAEKIMLSFKKS